MRHAGKTKPGVSRASGYCMERRTLVLNVQLGAAVARTAFRLVRTVVVGVRRDQAALAVTHRAHQATGVDAVAGQVVVHGAGAPLEQGLDVGIGTLRVGVASHLEAPVRVTLQDPDLPVTYRTRKRRGVAQGVNRT